MKTTHLRILLLVGCVAAAVATGWRISPFILQLWTPGEPAIVAPLDWEAIDALIPEDSGAASVAVKRRTKDDYSSIPGFNVTGYVEPEPDPVADVDLAPPRKPVSDLLDVVFIQFAEPNSLALVDYRPSEIKVQDGREARFLAVGAALPKPYQAITVTEITGDDVAFQNGDQVDRVAPQEYDLAETYERLAKVSKRSAGRERSGNRIEPPAATSEVEPGVWHISQEDVDRVTDLGTQAISGIGFKDGVQRQVGGRERATGVQVTRIPSTSPLAGLGIESRDTILSVNGDRVASKADLMRYFQKSGDQASFQFDVVSSTGQRRTITYHVP